MRIRLVLRVMAWNAALLLVVVLMAEAVFGSWFFGPDLGVLLNVPRNVVIRHDLSNFYPGGGIAIYRKDRYGFRGSYGDPADIDILVIGGSTTNELYTDDKDTWVEAMRRALARNGKALGVANAAVDGHSTVGHIRSFDHWFPNVPGLRPRFVLAYIGINDLFVLPELRPLYDAMTPEGFWQSAYARIRNASAIYNLVRTVRGAIRSRKVNLVYGSGLPRELKPVPVKNIEKLRAQLAKKLAKDIAGYRERVKFLAGRIKDFGARPIFVTQTRGDSFMVDGRLMGVGGGGLADRLSIGLLNQVTMAVCREAGGICIDLGAELEFSPSDFDDYIHPLPSGSRKIGEFLATRLLGHL
jgi:lysophospholipase L1-like esterase